MNQNVYLNQLGMLSALGTGWQESAANLFAAQAPGMISTDAYSPGRLLCVGQVQAALPELDARHNIRQQSRNNRLLLAALQQIRPTVEAAISRFGSDRIAIVLGTSTSGIAEGEQAMQQREDSGSYPAWYHYGQQELGSPAEFLADELGIHGPAYVISTACSSSAKALASAARLLRMGLVDAVLSGGVDTLCRFTIAGFSALESVSATRCNPASANRNGINIGEAAALFLMTREPGSVRLAGWGESSDGYHMSAPDPAGGGARRAIIAALSRAGLSASDIDYVNLHGTATPLNDAMECPVVADIFGATPRVSSTKPLTGHTLGAAGALEAAICWITLQQPDGRLPPHLWDGAADPALPALHWVAPDEHLNRPVRYALSNSFAFGGNNATLLLAREP